MPKGTTVLSAALDAGIHVPHYCFHPKLSIDGSCRMCLVHVEKAPKLQISCNTAATDGMVVKTDTPAVLEARKGVMELLLVNHPLDCPICDQAGECKLQEFAFQHGRGYGRTEDVRRKAPKRTEIGPRVVFDQERCILCRRCVRFTAEISGTRELAVLNMGDRSFISTYPGQPLDNPYSINTADICPVGALLSTEFHHKLRVWFLNETPGVCTSCSRGCNVNVGGYKDRVWRLTPRRNDAVNDTWMCDHGRLNIDYVNDERRARGAALRTATDGFEELPFALAIRRLADWVAEVKAQHGPQSVAVVASPQLTNEEAFLLRRLVRDVWGTSMLAVPVPMGEGDDFLVRPEKAANGRGFADLDVPGASLDQVLDECTAGRVKLLYVIGSEMLSVAGEARVRRALSGVERVVNHDILPTTISDHASLVIGGCTWAEKSGTYTNFEGRVQAIRAAISPPGGNLTEGEVFARLIASHGGASEHFDADRVLRAIAASVPAYGSVTPEAVQPGGVATGDAAQPAA
ncbi:MAG: (2Fe-2S)-binding protein [Deltaproteobacteria bacterium]|nr:(2Fe-2S)-binding protein [Deltaproteobacteria bacterium]